MGSSVLWKTELESHGPHQSVRKWWDFNYWVFSANKMRRGIESKGDIWIPDLWLLVVTQQQHCLVIWETVFIFPPFYYVNFVILLAPSTFCIMFSCTFRILHHVVTSVYLISSFVKFCLFWLHGRAVWKVLPLLPWECFPGSPTGIHISFHSSTSLKVTSIFTKSQTTTIE